MVQWHTPYTRNFSLSFLKSRCRTTGERKDRNGRRSDDELLANGEKELLRIDVHNTMQLRLP
jgi:hypothetical protein